jgi:hypothetical protein
VERKEERKNYLVFCILFISLLCMLGEDSQSQSESYITTYSLWASPSWYEALTWDPRPIFLILSSIILLTASVLLMWGALSDEKSG